MNKINCDVCGTAYPESSTQCPICGCVRSAESTAPGATSDQPSRNDSYTYVKGGRFSRANVKKRNQGKPVQSAPQAEYGDTGEVIEENGRADRGLVIAVCVLLLAIVAVVIYIITRFFGTGSLDDQGVGLIPVATTESVSILTEPEETTEQTVSATTEETVTSTTEETVDTTQPETQPVTQPATEPDNNYYVKPYKTNKDKQGNDASAPKGTSFPLKLIDATGEVMDVDWLVEDPTICSVEGNTVTALKRGVTKVYVVIDGETYYCIVRVT